MTEQVRIGLTLRDHLKPTILRARELGLVECVEANISPYIATDSVALLRGELARIGTPYTFHLTDSSVCSADFPTNHSCDAAVRFMASFSPLVVSDHFTASRVGELDLDTNLPIVANEAAIAVYTENVALWQATLSATGACTALEHVPASFDHTASTCSQGQAFARVMAATGSGILLDLHNAYCDERTSGEPAERFLARLPLEQVHEIHLAGGHSLADGTYCDGHSRDVPPRVFGLLAQVLGRARPKVIILEREHNFVELDNILRDLEHVHELVTRC